MIRNDTLAMFSCYFFFILVDFMEENNTTRNMYFLCANSMAK